MAGEWKPLGEVVSLASGNTPSKSNPDFWGGVMPWVSAKDMGNFWLEDSEDHLTTAGVEQASRIVPAGTALMLTRGMTLHNRVPICRVSTHVAFNQDVKAVLPRTGLLPRFLPYLLVGNHDRLHERVDSAGHGTGRLNTDEILALLVYVPSLAEQSAIADFAESLDDRIHNLRQTNATLEAIAAALFKSWFVDFDGVPAEDMQESELGLIPKGWRVGSLSDLCELKYGKALKATERREGDIPVYGSGGVTGYHDEALVTKPTIIVGRKGTVGSLYWQSTPCFPIDTVFYVEPRVSLHFCYYAMMRMGLHGLNTDAAVPGLNRDNAYRQSVILPNDDVPLKWDAVVSNIRARMDSVNEQVTTLATLRDTLLPRLISGQLTYQQTSLSRFSN
ncbi:MAG: restriction endonuclease subunit S [Burkholderiales bacterium]|jgi:type I restriction enzyme S subunit|nr:restriction endonuclease subunit S [Burkholderiales bacterium]